MPRFWLSVLGRPLNVSASDEKQEIFKTCFPRNNEKESRMLMIAEPHGMKNVEVSRIRRMYAVLVLVASVNSVAFCGTPY